MSLSGKVAVITGGASGIGRATAVQMAELGARVHAFDLSQSSLDGLPAPIVGHRVDVADSAAVNAAISEVHAAHDRIDILINAAGINAPGKAANDALIAANMKAIESIKSGRAPRHDFIENTTDEQFRRVLEVNLFSQFYCIRAVVPLMKAAGGGAIVNISSAAALMGVQMPLYYPASKAGVLGLTRAAAAELAPYNIRVNAIAPGGVDTPLMHEQPKEMVDFPVGMQPIQRLAQPEELARTAVFLADDEMSGFYTGQTLSPNGGLRM